MRLIDADALAERLNIKESCAECEYEHGGFCKKHGNFVDACEAIFDAPTIHPEPHWIPVTERLPEKFDYYLVSGNNSVWFARYENGRFLGVLSGHALDTVIAWMPLPEPYKGVTE